MEEIGVDLQEELSADEEVGVLGRGRGGGGKVGGEGGGEGGGERGEGRMVMAGEAFGA